jgi:predicted  nucleic acid-binding Zn-ribbon protein
MREICATAAHEQTAENIKKKKNEELNEVFEAIHLAIDNGIYNVHIYKPLQDETINALYEYGYEVEDYYNQREGYDYKIRW